MQDYIFLFIPIITMICAQLLKAYTDYHRGSFAWSKIFAGYGGMPSSHATFTTSLCTVIGLHEGIDSLPFALSIVFTVIILRDAVGFRADVGHQGKVLNTLIKKLPDREEYHYPLFEERTGHTIAEVAAGTALGVMVSIILYYSIL